MSKFVSFLNGLIIGSIAGVAIGLLMAPKSGQEMRDELKHEVDEILEEGRQATEQRRRELENQLNQLRDERP